MLQRRKFKILRSSSMSSGSKISLRIRWKSWRGRIAWPSARAWKASRPQGLLGSNPSLSARLFTYFRYIRGFEASERGEPTQVSSCEASVSLYKQQIQRKTDSGEARGTAEPKSNILTRYRFWMLSDTVPIENKTVSRTIWTTSLKLRFGQRL